MTNNLLGNRMSDSQPTDQHAQLVRELYEPWSRRSARQKLVAARAVQPLLECLRAKNESVIWVAISSLAELEATEAIEPLVELLEQGTLTLLVADALKSIAGQDFGADAKKWRQWLTDSGTLVKPSFDAPECIRQTADYLGIEPQGSDNSYRFKLSLADGRTQKVAVLFGREDADGDALVVIYSECGPANAKYYEAVLRKNVSIPSGAFAIRDIDGKPQFIIVDTLIAAAATANILAKKIEHIAARADAVEKSLTKEDKR